MIYPWLKAAHIFAMVLWMGGTLLAGLYLLCAARHGHSEAGLAIAVRRWDRSVTAPAMLAVWLFGVWMAQSAGWWSSGWLQFKLLLVIGLSGVHGVLSGQLRRLASAPDRTLPSRVAMIVPATLCLLVGAIVLVTVKPF